MKSFKLTFTLALTLFSATFCFAQNNLKGTWKVMKLNISDVILVDIAQDSILLTDAFWEKQKEKNGNADSATKAMTMGMLKATLLPAFSQMTFTIDQNGGIYEDSKHEKIGQYNAATQTITSVDGKSKQQKTYPVEYNDGLLKLVSPDAKDGVIMWCRKVN